MHSSRLHVFSRSAPARWHLAAPAALLCFFAQPTLAEAQDFVADARQLTETLEHLEKTSTQNCPKREHTLCITSTPAPATACFPGNNTFYTVKTRGLTKEANATLEQALHQYSKHNPFAHLEHKATVTMPNTVARARLLRADLTLEDVLASEPPKTVLSHTGSTTSREYVAWVKSLRQRSRAAMTQYREVADNPTLANKQRLVAARRAILSMAALAKKISALAVPAKLTPKVRANFCSALHHAQAPFRKQEQRLLRACAALAKSAGTPGNPCRLKP